MDTKINEIEVNGVKYVQKGSEDNTCSVNHDGMTYVIVRAKEAGVFAGYVIGDEEIEDFDMSSILLHNVRRLWYWVGAASCSQLAIDGVSKPSECKFPAPNKKIVVANVIEIILCSEKARKSIEGVAIWKA